MIYDVKRIVLGMASDQTEIRLSATTALEQALRAELETEANRWESLTAQVLPPLLRALGDEHKGVQVHAANCLELLSHHSPQVVQALRQVMAGSDSWAAWGAALVMARLGLWFPEMRSALGHALGADDRDVRWAAANLSVNLTRRYPEAATMVKKTLKDPNPTSRKMAAYCLGAMGSHAPVEDVLVLGLSDPEPDVRRAVVLALGKLPEIAPDTVQQIASLQQKDPDAFVRRTAKAIGDRLRN